MLSCETLRGNGHVAQQMMTAFARAKGPGLADWRTGWRSTCRSPNGMVDRIAPATTEQDIDALAEASGIQDDWPKDRPAEAGLDLRCTLLRVVSRFVTDVCGGCTPEDQKADVCM